MVRKARGMRKGRRERIEKWSRERIEKRKRQQGVEKTIGKGHHHYRSASSRHCVISPKT